MVNVDMDRRRTVSKAAFHALMAEAAESGAYDLPRREGSDHITPVDGMTATVMTRLESCRRDADGRIVNATDPWFLTEAEIAGRRQALEYVRFLRRPGARLRARVARRRSARRSASARRDGSTATTGSPATTCWRRATSTTRSACAARRSRTTTPAPTRPGSTCPTARRSASPIGRLLVRDAANVLVAGRCFSATHDAHASVRSHGPVHGDGPGGRHGRRAAVGRRASIRATSTSRPCAIGCARDGAILELPDPGGGGRAMTFVRTVLGDIDPSELGVTYAHEHLDHRRRAAGPDGARLRPGRRGRDGRARSPRRPALGLRSRRRRDAL